MKFNGFDHIQEDERNKDAIIALSLAKCNPPWNLIEEPTTIISGSGGVFELCPGCVLEGTTETSGFTYGGFFVQGTLEAAEVPTSGVYIVADVLSTEISEVFTATVGRVSRPNLVKVTLLQQIESLPETADYYEADENPPNRQTKEDAKRLILNVSPSGVLAGADVYAYYGDINISWEIQRKKIKLTIPAHGSNRPLSLYHGQMQGGRVTESDTEKNVTADRLRKWLDWFAA
jgi:hypothetical protein